ncbi:MULTISPECIES: hypothetical protein [Pseudorhizobium]|uniref:Uncharacterized protein n=1 Tax=Pseudorhizobium flavum TaxID=1335061 RepID=A0A7W9YVI3_9HYPH|nr:MULTISPECIES: hypothetical protein [Pseudorhizobium]MBB6179047.1 hypothetical protein [Pseudorhizobium flavum]
MVIMAGVLAEVGEPGKTGSDWLRNEAAASSSSRDLTNRKTVINGFFINAG